MKIAQINVTSGVGSTGKIAVAISNLLNNADGDNYIICSSYSVPRVNCISLRLPMYYKMQALKSRLFGNYGFNSHIATFLLIRKLKEIKPDIVQLHNVHGHNVNLRMLFNYISNNNIKVVWTFHDCWAFTGYCTHFDYIGCQKWKSSCFDCPQKKKYSWFFDRSKYLYEKKRRLTLSLPALTIVCPSQWMKRKVEGSFLSNIKTVVINNGINLSIFSKNNIIKQPELIKKFRDKIIILAVSFIWDKSKGIDVVSKLSYDLGDNFRLIVVGVKKEQVSLFSDDTICIQRTNDQSELVMLYTMADLFINPTREDTFPTVNIESLACGTPVLTFKTGGSPEIIDSETGYVVDKDDYNSFLSVIKKMSKKTREVSQRCRQRASFFRDSERFACYINLYKRL